MRKREKPSSQSSKRKNRKEGIMEPKGGEWVQTETCLREAFGVIAGVGGSHW